MSVPFFSTQKFVDTTNSEWYNGSPIIAAVTRTRVLCLILCSGQQLHQGPKRCFSQHQKSLPLSFISKIHLTIRKFTQIIQFFSSFHCYSIIILVYFNHILFVRRLVLCEVECWFCSLNLCSKFSNLYALIQMQNQKAKTHWLAFSCNDFVVQHFCTKKCRIVRNKQVERVLHTYKLVETEHLLWVYGSNIKFIVFDLLNYTPEY